MDIVESTTRYETWLKQQIPIIDKDLEAKHQAMAADPFSFLRATFYRWVQAFPEACTDDAQAPVVLAVGDLHVENFGTWRDSDGRLVWGVNDLDEASTMPYALDLVRLATSANLALRSGHLAIAFADACDAIVGGYTDALNKGGLPFVLAESHQWLGKLAAEQQRRHDQFWAKLDKVPSITESLPGGVKSVLEQHLPEAGLAYRVVHRIAGLGSLGRQRYAAIADWRGGKVAREAKQLAPSAYTWDRPGDGTVTIQYQALLDRAVRCQDPYLTTQGGWVVRRLAADCSRVELTSLPDAHDESHLLRSMGWETGNVHLGTSGAKHYVLGHLSSRKSGWLQAAADAMTHATLRDWEAWKKAQVHA
jgi:uncharacterized protein (DUF2252 family)